MIKLILKILMIILLGYISYKFIKKYGTEKNKGTRFLILIPVSVLCCMTFFTEIKALFSPVKNPVKNVEVLEVKKNGHYWLGTSELYYKMSIKDTLKIPVVINCDNSEIQINGYSAETIKSILINPAPFFDSFYFGNNGCDNAVMIIGEEIKNQNIKEFEILAVKKGVTAIKFISEAGANFVIIYVE